MQGTLSPVRFAIPESRSTAETVLEVKDLSVTNADANSAYFDDAYLGEHFDEIDAAWQAWKGS